MNALSRWVAKAKDPGAARQANGAQDAVSTSCARAIGAIGAGMPIPAGEHAPVGSAVGRAARRLTDRR